VAALVAYSLSDRVSRLALLNQSLSVTLDVVAAKDLLIREGVASIKVGMACILLALMVALLFSSFISHSLTRAFSGLGNTVALVGVGDLRLRFQTKNKDEWRPWVLFRPSELKSPGFPFKEEEFMTLLCE